MIYPVYCIRDVKVEFDAQLFIQPNEIAAMRGFKFMLSNPDTMQGKFPSDYELYQIAEFNTESGIVTGIIPPKFVCGGNIVDEK